MAAPTFQPAFPPPSVTRLLRVEGLAIFIAALAAYHLIGGNWWLFALLILAPDLAFLAALAGAGTGVRAYNLAHTYSVPIALGVIGQFAGLGWALPVAAIWVAHIGMDRALGYGLKYPSRMSATHLGWIGKDRREANHRADAS